MRKQLLLPAMASLVIMFCSASFALAAETADEEKKAAEQIAQYEKEAIKTPSGLQFVVLREGAGDKPASGQFIAAHYTGRLMNGKIFDRSSGSGPISFAVGIGQVIAGWDEALMDMRPGEKRALIVPPDLGYGKQGAGGVIPPDATLFFEVERLR